MLVQSFGSKKSKDRQLNDAPSAPNVSSAFTPSSIKAPLATIPLIKSIEKADRVAGSTFTLPSAEQKVALIALKEFDEDSILAWLILLQSIQPGPSGIQPRSGTGYFSTQQLDALTTLQNCHISNVIVWLQDLRLACQ